MRRIPSHSSLMKLSPIFAGFLLVRLSTLLSAFSSWLLNCGSFGLQIARNECQRRDVILFVRCCSAVLLRPFFMIFCAVFPWCIVGVAGWQLYNSFYS